MKLSPLFSDYMVFQQGKPIAIWGSGIGTVKASIAGNSATAECVNGVWNIKLPPLTAGGPYEVVLEDETDKITLHDVMIGEVWLAAGQSNMEQPTFATEGGFEAAENADMPEIRFFTVPRRTFKDCNMHSWHFESVLSQDGKWEKCTPESALHFSGIGFYFAEMLQKCRGVAVGIISCNYGGTKIEPWIEQQLIFSDNRFLHIKEKCENALKNKPFEIYKADYEAYRKQLNDECVTAENAVTVARNKGAQEFAFINMINWPTEPPFGPMDQNWPGSLYENMLKTIVPFSLAGVLWYQGESNASENMHYSALFEVFVKQIRRDWQENLPIFTVQIAPFMHSTPDIWPLLVEQQIKAAKDNEGVYIITTSDLGEKHNIHPIRKHQMAQRLFFAALNVVYGKDTEYCGPIVKTAVKRKNSVEIEFSHSEGLCCDGEVAELTVCGADNFHISANSRIENDKLIVCSDKVTDIKEVRLGFTNYSEINLYNKYGFVAAPFRIKVQ